MVEFVGIDAAEVGLDAPDVGAIDGDIVGDIVGEEVGSNNWSNLRRKHPVAVVDVDVRETPTIET